MKEQVGCRFESGVDREEMRNSVGVEARIGSARREGEREKLQEELV